MKLTSVKVPYTPTICHMCEQHEKALDALIAYLRAIDADARRHAKEVCDTVIVKCLTSRSKTVEKAQAVFMLWVELEAVDFFLVKWLNKNYPSCGHLLHIKGLCCD